MNQISNTWYKCPQCHYESQQECVAVPANQPEVVSDHFTNPDIYKCKMCNFAAPMEFQPETSQICGNSNSADLSFAEVKIEVNPEFESPEFLCPYCGVEDVSQISLLEHVDVCHYRVDEMESGQVDETSLYKISRVQEISPYVPELVDRFRCPHCSFTSTKKSCFVRHMNQSHKSIHRPLELRCIQCHHVTKQTLLIKRASKKGRKIKSHVKTEPDETRSNIKIESKTKLPQVCLMEYSEANKLRLEALIKSGNNQIAKTPTERLQCPHCPVTYSKRISFVNHLGRHHNSGGADEDGTWFRCVFCVHSVQCNGNLSECDNDLYSLRVECSKCDYGTKLHKSTLEDHRANHEVVVKGQHFVRRGLNVPFVSSKQAELGSGCQLERMTVGLNA